MAVDPSGIVISNVGINAMIMGVYSLAAHKLAISAICMHIYEAYLTFNMNYKAGNSMRMDHQRAL